MALSTFSAVQEYIKLYRKYHDLPPKELTQLHAKKLAKLRDDQFKKAEEFVNKPENIELKNEFLVAYSIHMLDK